MAKANDGAVLETGAETGLMVNDRVTKAEQKLEEGLRFGPKVKTKTDHHFPLDQIHAPDDFNVRISKGMVVAGIKVEKDLRNISGMAEQIKELGGITDPLVLSKREDGTHLLLQGYRRYNAAKLIRRDEPDTPLADKLATVPVVVYSGLTAAQERTLVNDQKSKAFSALEVYRWFNEQLDGGHNWMAICRRSYHQIGQVTNNLANVQKIDAIEDPKERDKQLKDWLTSYVFQWWVTAWKAGPLLRQMSEHTYLWREGGTTQRPRVVVDSMRMRKIQKAITEDEKAGQFNRNEGSGPRMLKVLDGLAAEDEGLYDENGKKRNRKSERTEGFRPFKEVQEFLGRHGGTEDEPSLVKRLIGITFKGGGDPGAVASVGNFDRCSRVYEQHRAYLKPDLVAVFDLVFQGTENAADQFTAFLIDNYSEVGAARHERDSIRAADGLTDEKKDTPADELTTEDRESLARVDDELEAMRAERESVSEDDGENDAERSFREPEGDENGEFSLAGVGDGETADAQERASRHPGGGRKKRKK